MDVSGRGLFFLLPLGVVVLRRCPQRSSARSSITSFFFATMIEEKKIEFKALKQRDMTIAEYHAMFLALERFALGTVQTKRQQSSREDSA